MLTTTRLRVAVAVAAALVSAAVAACGGGESGKSIDVWGHDFRFSPNEITIRAGEPVTLRLRNAAKQDHDLEVRGLQAEIIATSQKAGDHPAASPGTLYLHTARGKSASVTFKALRPGTYEVWCLLPGHKELGMVGKLVVTAEAGERAAGARE